MIHKCSFKLVQDFLDVCKTTRCPVINNQHFTTFNYLCNNFVQIIKIWLCTIIIGQKHRFYHFIMKPLIWTLLGFEVFVTVNGIILKIVFKISTDKTWLNVNLDILNCYRDKSYFLKHTYSRWIENLARALII